MTEFEEQVAAALCYGHDAPLVLADRVNACRYCQDRAPRVAAAIEKGIQAAFDTLAELGYCPSEPESEDFRRTVQKAAAAALRGTPAP